MYLAQGGSPDFPIKEISLCKRQWMTYAQDQVAHFIFLPLKMWREKWK